MSNIHSTLYRLSLQVKGSTKECVLVWLFCAQTEFLFIDYLNAIELVSLTSVTKNLINLDSK